MFLFFFLEMFCSYTLFNKKNDVEMFIMYTLEQNIYYNALFIITCTLFNKRSENPETTKSARSAKKIWSLSSSLKFLFSRIMFFFFPVLATVERFSFFFPANFFFPLLATNDRMMWRPEKKCMWFWGGWVWVGCAGRAPARSAGFAS